MAAKKMITSLLPVLAVFDIHLVLALPKTESWASTMSVLSEPPASNTLHVLIPPGPPGEQDGDPSSQSTSTTTGLSSATTSATMISLAVPAIPKVLATIPDGFSLGCWLESSTPDRALNGAFFEQHTSMTPSVCSQLCSEYTFYGLQYGSQCMCGNNIQPGRAFPIPSSRCEVPCTGDSNQSCGGSGTIDLYQTLSPPAPFPYGHLKKISYTSVGCYAEPTTGGRALDGFVLADVNMTLAFCAQICGMSNYQYFGVEYGNECWCAHSISPAATPTNTSSCDSPCAGDSSETCGGLLTISVWNGTYLNMESGLEDQDGEELPLKGGF